MSKLTGSCLCGDIAYAIEGPGESMLHCHCSMCRKHHGSAFQTVVAVASSRFQWLSGQDRLATYESSPGFGRSFCPRCGSTLPPREVSGDPVFVPAGNLDGDPDARPVMHIFTGSKAAWYSIADDLPQHDAYPTGFDGPVLDDPDAGPPQAASCRGSCLCGKVRFRFTGTTRAMRNWFSIADALPQFELYP